MENTIKNERSTEYNYGIDLLRMVAMFMVIILHLLFQGGIIVSYGTKSAGFEAAWFLEIAALCAVNCYALISGYVGFHSKYRYTGIVTLWLRVLYYTIAITAAFAFFLPETVGTTQWINAIFPATTKQYWYFTAYLCLFLFVPLLNKAVSSLNQKQLRLILLGMFLVFSVTQTIYQQDAFGTNKGYSGLWLILLYLLGATVKKYDSLRNITIPKAFFGYLFMVVLTWGTRLVLEFSTIHYLGEQKWECILVEYTSPTILAASIFLFALFEKLTLRTWQKKIIAFLSPSAFSVYLIHTQPLVWTYILANRYKEYTELSPPVMIFSVLGTALAIYLFCSLLDLIRRLLSRLLQVKKRVSRLEKRILGETWSS